MNRPLYTFRVYRAADGWRWRFVAPNGRVMADSGEAYARRDSAVKAAERVQQVIADFRSVVRAV